MLKIVVVVIIVIVLLLFGLVGILTSKYNQQKKNYLEFWGRKAKEDGEILYIALGDSTATGIGASSPEKTYVWRIKELYEKKTGKKVRVVNLGVPGAKTQDLIDIQLPKLLNYKDPNLVTVSIGANDSNHDIDPSVIIKNLEKIILSLPKGSYIAEIPGIRFKDKNKTLEINSKIKLIASNNNVKVVPIYEVLLKHINDLSIYDIDFFHPNDKGYSIWKDAFWSTINK